VSSIDRLAQRKVNSAFGYLDVDYKKMVYLSVTGRNDGPLPAKTKQFLLLPSASLGVIPSTCSNFPNLFPLQSSGEHGPGFLLTI
jgi:hypothetical protein